MDTEPDDVDLLVVGGGKAGKSLAMDRAKAAWARHAGHEVKVARIDAAAVPRSKTLHETTGTWKAVIDADTDLILGAALLGHDAGEVIAALQMAMLGGLRYQQVRDAVITHPTMAEGLNLLFDSLDG